ncbi:MAG: preprotein translocase subunit SecG [Candidatus Vogelbacteria bacterium CG22_combo_CG10-13_8_21_14_all_37_9]|uniref:Protein-export membrane protein SecG n=1 Tax=Candidatus Vogelbacteria bacterium CG22_combo_CG10-13_8_21_14_all_37_9 TaxID=1975046 RepID=A0A2H0BKA9_9BACT|nr:MAG: preprotein translocase subunit SecG [bacterium CG10_37_50]PIP58116.1 MAG: preprotein translocase subunit SecG [Candidatus Vogelbacteria bacterium CG22_combo_CG10-13_8_21_14_all_37_9]
MQFISLYLPYVQIGLAIALIITILFQQSDAGLGSAFGGNSSSNPFSTKRGFEKTLFIITIILAILFIASTILALF